MTSLADVADRARRFSKRLRKRAFDQVSLFVMAFVYALLDGGSLQQRIGCWLVILTATCMGILGLIQLSRHRQVPRSDDRKVWALYYRSELDRLCSGVGLAHLFALTFYFFGLLLGIRDKVHSNLMFAVLGMLILVSLVLVFLRKRQQSQRQLDELDAVLEETR